MLLLKRRASNEVAAMKSFRLYIHRPLPVNRLGSECTPEEQNCLRENFKRTVDRYRTQWRVAWVGLSGLVIGFVLHISLGAYLPAWSWAPVLVCGLVGIVALTAAFEMPCPNCNNDILLGWGKFCPCCGSDRFWGGCCLSCRRRQLCPRQFQFYTRFCTYCGLTLDDKRLI